VTAMEKPKMEETHVKKEKKSSKKVRKENAYGFEIN